MHRKRVWLGSTIAATALGLTACTTGAAPESLPIPTSEPVNILEVAQFSYEDVDSATISMTQETTFGNTHLMLSADGIIDFRANRMQSTVSTAGSMPALKIHFIVDGTNLYVRPGSQEAWYMMDEVPLAWSADMKEKIGSKMLRRVRHVGPATLDGQPVTLFRGKADFAKALAGFGTPKQLKAVKKVFNEGELSLWLDDQNRVIRVGLTSSATHSGQQVTYELDYRLSNFGVPVSISEPPASDVRDYSELASGAVGLLS